MGKTNNMNNLKNVNVNNENETKKKKNQWTIMKRQRWEKKTI